MPTVLPFRSHPHDSRPSVYGVIGPKAGAVVEVLADRRYRVDGQVYMAVARD
jgi:hypothetical protein